MSVPQVEDTFRVNCFSCCTASRLDRLALRKGEGRVRVSPGIWCRRNSLPLTSRLRWLRRAGNPLPLRRGEAERTIQFAAKSRILSK